MHDSTPAASRPRPLAGNGPGSALATAALIIMVFGVLPFAWDAAAIWKLVGPVVAVALSLPALRQVWRQVFSTSPRHLAT
jgi:hypothetical protein